MQTFLPYADFRESARVLDWRRLGKQRVEAKQILLALTRRGYGWQNHPAVRQWRGYEVALARYGVAICREWRRRGYRDTLLPWFLRRARARLKTPPWLGDFDYHRSHRSNLVRKDWRFYRQHFSTPSNLPYIWPT